MNKRTIEYVIIIIAVILLIYACYFSVTYKYPEKELALDSITLLCPENSEYKISGDTIEFKVPSTDIYDLNITKTNSSDDKVSNLINYYSTNRQGDIAYLNESCYIVSVYSEFGEFHHHSMIIPIDSFDKDNLTFKNESAVWVYDGNNEEFVLDSAYNSEVVI